QNASSLLSRTVGKQLTLKHLLINGSVLYQGIYSNQSYLIMVRNFPIGKILAINKTLISISRILARHLKEVYMSIPTVFSAKTDCLKYWISIPYHKRKFITSFFKETTYLGYH